MPQKSTERSRITLSKHVAKVIAICAKQLRFIRLVEHTASDAVVVAVDFCERAMPKHVKLMANMYVPERDSQFAMKIRRDVLELVTNNAKALGVSRRAYLYAISTLFSRALLAKVWRGTNQTFEQLKGLYPDVIVKMASTNTSYLDLPSARAPTASTRKLKRIREKTAMRYHKYIEDFRAYMQERGGLESLLDQVIALDIHARPILGNVGHGHSEDVPIETNAKRRYSVRLWKRGRGYNITVLNEIDTGNYDSEIMLIPIGTVYRLYDIYRNINWDSLTITKD